MYDMLHFVGLEILTAVSVKITNFLQCDSTQCGSHVPCHIVDNLFKSCIILGSKTNFSLLIHQNASNLILQIVHCILIGNNIYTPVTCTLPSEKWDGSIYILNIKCVVWCNLGFGSFFKPRIVMFFKSEKETSVQKLNGCCELL